MGQPISLSPVLLWILAAALCTSATKSGCPCSPAWLCDPVKAKRTQEQFVYHRAGDDSWRSYDWRALTTIGVFGGNPSVDLVCYAHARQVRLVSLVGFPQAQLPNATARSAFVKSLVASAQAAWLDGVNLDIEGDTQYAEDLTALTLEVKNAFRAWDPATQVSFAINPIQGAGYNFRALASILDFVFVMFYDMNWGTPTGESNDPIPRIESDMARLTGDLGVPANKIVVGLPWYGYDFPCASLTPDHHCTRQPGPFNASLQISYARSEQVVAESRAAGPFADTASGSVFYEYHNAQTGLAHQLWIDGPDQIAARVKLAKSLAVRGVGVWHADCLNYTQGLVGSTAAMWDALFVFVEP